MDGGRWAESAEADGFTVDFLIRTLCLYPPRSALHPLLITLLTKPSGPNPLHQNLRPETSAQTLCPMPPDLDLLRGTLDLLILKTLSWGPMHGLAVLHWIEDVTGQRLQIEEGALYPALHRME